MNYHLNGMEGFVCPCDPGSCVVGAMSPWKGLPKVSWSQRRGQTEPQRVGLGRAKRTSHTTGTWSITCLVGEEVE